MLFVEFYSVFIHQFQSIANCSDLVQCVLHTENKKKALFHISKTELFSYRLSVQACQLDIGWLSPVKVNQTSCLNNLSLVVNGIWFSIPIGWALADILGILLLKNNLRQEWKQLQVQLFVNKKAKYPKI